MERRSIGRWTLWVPILGVVVAIVGIALNAVMARETTTVLEEIRDSVASPIPSASLNPIGDNEGRNPGTETASPSETPVPSVKPSPNQRFTDSPPGVSQPGFAVEIEKYCFCDGPRSQAQVKVKPAIANHSETRQKLDLDRFRLVVDMPLKSEWSPRRPAGDVVDLEPLTEEPLLGIPPNGDGAAETFSGSHTFATHWADPVVAPGETFFDGATKSGDLVFYVPTNGEPAIAVYGIAIVTTSSDGAVTSIDGYAPLSVWQEEADPNSF